MRRGRIGAAPMRGRLCIGGDIEIIAKGGGERALIARLNLDSREQKRPQGGSRR
jgi:hypothetical protein